MKIEYCLFNPTGNITLLVTTAVPEAMQSPLSKALMATEPTAEQTGFISPAGDEWDIALRMSGGEFCGNAAMSAAALYSINNKLPSCNVRVKVAGTEKPVEVHISETAAGEYTAGVNMPRPASAGERRFTFDKREYSLPLVDFRGISHIIIENKRAIDDNAAMAAVKQWCMDLNVPALGLMFLNPRRGELRPLVYVRETDTIFWESSCASGTSAVGAYLRTREKKPISLTFKEPAGALRIDADEDGNLCLWGKTKLEKQKSVYI